MKKTSEEAQLLKRWKRVSEGGGAKVEGHSSTQSHLNHMGMYTAMSQG